MGLKYIFYNPEHHNTDLGYRSDIVMATEVIDADKARSWIVKSHLINRVDCNYMIGVL